MDTSHLGVLAGIVLVVNTSPGGDLLAFRYPPVQREGGNLTAETAETLGSRATAVREGETAGSGKQSSVGSGSEEKVRSGRSNSDVVSSGSPHHDESDKVNEVGKGASGGADSGSGKVGKKGRDSTPSRPASAGGKGEQGNSRSDTAKGSEGASYSALTLPSVLLAPALLPKHQLLDRDFDLSIDDYTFVGYPVSVSRATRKAQDFPALEETSGAAQEPDEPGEDPGQEAKDELRVFSVCLVLHRSPHRLLSVWQRVARHLTRVLIHEQLRCEYVSAQIHAMLMVRDAWLAAQLDEEVPQHVKPDHMALASQLLTTCSLARELRSVVHSIRACGVANIRINGWVTMTTAVRARADIQADQVRPYHTLLLLSPNTPSPAEMSKTVRRDSSVHAVRKKRRRKSKERDGGEHSDRAPPSSDDTSSSGIDSMWVDGDDISFPGEDSFDLDSPFSSSASSSDADSEGEAESAHRQFESVESRSYWNAVLPPDCSPALKKLIFAANPTSNMRALSSATALPFHHVCQLAAHLCYWDHAVLSPVLSKSSRVRTRGSHSAALLNAALRAESLDRGQRIFALRDKSDASQLVRDFSTVFPGISLVRTLHTFSQLPLKTLKEHAQTFGRQTRRRGREAGKVSSAFSNRELVLVVAWLLRHRVVESVHYFPVLTATEHEIPGLLAAICDPLAKQRVEAMLPLLQGTTPIEELMHRFGLGRKTLMGIFYDCSSFISLTEHAL